MLSTPPAFILSQNQTLHRKNCVSIFVISVSIITYCGLIFYGFLVYFKDLFSFLFVTFNTKVISIIPLHLLLSTFFKTFFLFSLKTLFFNAIFPYRNTRIMRPDHSIRKRKKIIKFFNLFYFFVFFLTFFHVFFNFSSTSSL